MARSRPWPFEDDNRPSGSVQTLSQADLQAILAHLDDDRDELLAGTGVDRPVVAVRPRASVGRPGGSAQARWRRVRAAEWAAWTRTLPWRVAATRSQRGQISESVDRRVGRHDGARFRTLASVPGDQ
jgi:hypothetical protein